MVTKGHRRLGKTIRKLEKSVELSPKESRAKESEKKYKERLKTTQTPQTLSGDTAVQDLREIAARRKNQI